MTIAAPSEAQSGRNDSDPNDAPGRGRSGLTSILLGSVSRYITTHSGLPVMIVK